MGMIWASGRFSAKTARGLPAWVSVLLCGLFSLCFTLPASAQDWFRTGTGLGVTKARVAVADFAGKSPSSQPLAIEFSDVVRSDLDYSGILELVSKSFY